MNITNTKPYKWTKLDVAGNGKHSLTLEFTDVNLLGNSSKKARLEQLGTFLGQKKGLGARLQKDGRVTLTLANGAIITLVQGTHKVTLEFEGDQAEKVCALFDETRIKEAYHKAPYLLYQANRLAERVEGLKKHGLRTTFTPPDEGGDIYAIKIIKDPGDHALFASIKRQLNALSRYERQRFGLEVTDHATGIDVLNFRVSENDLPDFHNQIKAIILQARAEQARHSAIAAAERAARVEHIPPTAAAAAALPNIVFNPETAADANRIREEAARTLATARHLEERANVLPRKPALPLLRLRHRQVPLLHQLLPLHHLYQAQLHHPFLVRLHLAHRHHQLTLRHHRQLN